MAQPQNRTIYCRDNLDVLRGLNSACVDLVYLDPPFNKKKVFTAPIGTSAEGASFKDIFTQEDLKEEWVQDIKEDNFELHLLLEAVRNIEGRTSYNFCYLAYMAIRLIECRRVLKDAGSIYLHCDPTMSHYLKWLMDCIFGEDNFRNEIIWSYRRWPARQKNFQKMHNIIFRYSKGTEVVWNQLYESLAESTLKSDKGEKILNVFDDEGKRMRGKKTGEKSPVAPMSDTWNISFIAATGKERTGYPTQKPLALLERIIAASSNEGDVVLDPFCGCATTCVAAEKLNRQWIGVDISVKAYELVKERLKNVEKTLNGDEPPVDYDKEIQFSASPPKRTDDGADAKDRKYVYVISHPNYAGEYKVGVAKDVKSRLNSYQTSDPDRAFKLEHKRLTEHYRALERHIHEKFDNKREWVRADLRDIVDAIESYEHEDNGKLNLD